MSDFVVPAWAWALLAGVMILLIAIDLFAHRGDRIDSRRRALVWTVVWIAAAAVFGGIVAVWFGASAAEQFFAAYLLEKSLSIDNLFLFIVIFGALGIPRGDQRRVLTWGILGALATRAAFVAVGAAVLERWHEITYVFGAILLFTALQMLRDRGSSPSRLLGWLERHLPWTRDHGGHHFVVRRTGSWFATPLLVALIAIEASDIVFALDSIPAAFAVSEHPFIVYSSNVFAVLGLRALYSVLVGAIAELRYLKYGLSAILAFAGAKMLAAPWLVISPLASVAAIALVVAIAVVASVMARRRPQSPTDPVGGGARLP